MKLRHAIRECEEVKKRNAPWKFNEVFFKIDILFYFQWEYRRGLVLLDKEGEKGEEEDCIKKEMK